MNTSYEARSLILFVFSFPPFFPHREVGWEEAFYGAVTPDNAEGKAAMSALQARNRVKIV